MLYIRADGNCKIGLGHIMRCLSIAKEIVNRGDEVCFLLASDEPVEVLKKNGMPYKILGTHYTDMESEKNTLYHILKKGDKILVDSYFVTNSYFMFLQQFGQVFYVDDMHFFEYCVDGIINGNIYGDMEVYDAEITMLGCEFSPLRSEYRQARMTKEPRKILVTTGGSDPYKITEKLVEKINNDEMLKKQEYEIICGLFNDSYNKLKKIETKNPQIKVYRNVSNMWEYMQRASIAITAGGSTMTELSCMGVPMVCFSFVENQERIVDTFVSKGYVYYGGHYRTEGDIIVAKVCEAVKTLIRDEELRNDYSRKLMKLVDGKGCIRIADAILQTDKRN